MIIDIHNHLSPQNSPYRLPADMYLQAMDEAGVDKAVILGKDYGRLGDSQDANLADEDTADFVGSHPDRFVGFTAVHPDRNEKENLERLERAVGALGLRGVKLNPASGFYPNDKRLYPVYERAAELDIPVVVHSGIKPPSEGTRVKYCNPLDLDDVAVDFPRLKLIIAHAGYPWVDEAVLAGLYAENVFADISTLNQIEDVMGCAVIEPTLKKLYQSLGAGRIVFGSDGIFNFDPLITAVTQADFLSDSDKEKVFYKNAQGILGL